MADKIKAIDKANALISNKNVHEFKWNAADSTLQASPELTYMQALKEAYWSSQAAVGSKPMVFIEHAGAGIRDVFLKQVRSNLSAEVDLGLTGALRDMAHPIFWTFSGDWTRPGDQQVSAALEKKSDDFWAQRGRPDKFGQYDFQMAAGWIVPKGTKINGIASQQDETISNMLAVFIRDKDGNIEVLNPSAQVGGFTDLTKVPRALWGDPENAVDKRWQETAGTYVEAQLAPMIASVGLGAVGKISDIAVGKAPKIAGLANRVHDAEKMLNHGALKSVATLNGVSGGAMIADAFVGQPHLKAAALHDIVHLLSNPALLNADNLKKNLNEALHSYTYDKGSHAQQVYIPSLKSRDNPFAVLESLVSSGNVMGYRKKSNPWEDWGTPVPVSVSDVRDSLLWNKGFEKAVLTAGEKALSGKKLSDNDIFILRTNLALKTGEKVILGQNSDERSLSYSRQERLDTISKVRNELNQSLVAKAAEDPKLAIQLGVSQSELKSNAIDSALGLVDPYQFSDKQLSAFIKTELQTVSSDIVNEQKDAQRKMFGVSDPKQKDATAVFSL